MALASPSLATPTTESEFISQQIEQALASMTSTARAADVGGYMLHIDADRPLLLAEQRAWALNLRKNPPVEIEFSLAKNAAIEFDDADGASGSAVADITLAWMPAPDPEHPNRAPEPVSVSFAARFEPMFDPEWFPDTRWVFAGVAWEVELVAPDGSRVLAIQRDEKVAHELIEILPGALASAAACFEAEVPTATVKLYPTVALLNASISPGLSAPIAGWNEPNESIKLVSAAMGMGAESILTHEAAHAVQFTMGDKPLEAPWWALEGSAERAADLAKDPEASNLSMVGGMVRWWASKNELANFADLAVYDERMPAGVEKAYIQGHHFIAYLDEAFSNEARNAWLRLLLGGVGIEDASERVFKESFGELDQSWRASLVEAAASEP